MSDTKKTWWEDSWTQISEEDRSRNEIITDILPSSLQQPQPECVENLPQLTEN